MRLDQSSMDLSTFAEKVKNGELDLQPDFQRGQVWPEAKKKKLIDTILRQWYVPAVHIVVNDDLDREEVLDGQQRLRAILDFMGDKFAVDGQIEPSDNKIQALHGLTYSKLPDAVRSRFRRFPIGTVRLREYLPEEPGELFFRLNTLTALTAAEHRNALIGEPRNQVRRLAEDLERAFAKTTLGFSNARMNYDDVLARLAITLEAGRLDEKVTAASLERRYRSGRGFGRYVTDQIASAITALANASHSDVPWKQNKATLFSWLYFITDNRWVGAPLYSAFFDAFINAFESYRSGSRTAKFAHLSSDGSAPMITPTIREAVLIFNDRASSRVNDVSSVILRDLCLNVAAYEVAPTDVRQIEAVQARAEVLRRLGACLLHPPEDVAERAAMETEMTTDWQTYREARQSK